MFNLAAMQSNHKHKMEKVSTFIGLAMLNLPAMEWKEESNPPKQADSIIKEAEMASQASGTQILVWPLRCFSSRSLQLVNN